MTAANNGQPTYDVVGMTIIGHATPIDKLTLDGSQTSDPSAEQLYAGVTYRLWGNKDFCYVLHASAPIADSGDIPVTARVNEYVMPKENTLIAVVDLGDVGNVWIAKMERYGE